jgi:hypothetical protein
MIIGLLFLFLFVFSGFASAAYGPGDTIQLRYPESGIGLVLLEKPKYVRYTMYDSTDTVVYEVDHNIIYIHDLGFGLGYSWYDEYDMAIPGFPTPGEWRVTGRLYSELLWVIDDPAIIPFETEFYVEEGNLMENLLAPSYFTLDMGITGGRISLALPFHWSLPLIGIVIIIIVIIAIKKYMDLSVSHGSQ